MLDPANPRYQQTLTANFASLTAENEMKMDALQPERGKFSFATADRLMGLASSKGMEARGHTLVWHNQLPGWLTSRSWTRAELLEVLREHVTTVASHFRGRVAEWDVVNEAMNDNGTLRRNIWLDTIGPEYIDYALRWAHQADPSARLVLNDFTNERINAKSNAYLSLARELQDRGVPLHGLGMQMHVLTNWYPPRAELERNISRFAAIGLTVSITEMDVKTSGTAGTAADRLAAQEKVYRTVADACIAQPACARLTTWGVSDAITWLGSEEMPLLFDSEYRPKSAWSALQPLLAGN